MHLQKYELYDQYRGLYVTSPVSPYSDSRALFGAISRYLLSALVYGLVKFFPPKRLKGVEPL